MDDTIEIWNADTANGAFMDADAFAQQLEDLMTPPAIPTLTANTQRQ